MAKPWIAIPTRYYSKTETVGQIQHYLDAVVWAGGLPLMLPVGAPAAIVREYMKMARGILLPGSPTDIDPVHYGETEHARLGKKDSDRDALDFALIEHAERNGAPLLGICFGAQSLNVYRGGTLIQDIPSLVPQALPHESDRDSAPPARHLVRLDEKSLLARVAGTANLEVNSYHHQSILAPGRSLRVAATAPDGVIEAVEDSEGRFIVGVQWHPERGWKDDAFAQALFRRFIEAADEAAG